MNPPKKYTPDPNQKLLAGTQNGGCPFGFLSLSLTGVRMGSLTPEAKGFFFLTRFPRLKRIRTFAQPKWCSLTNKCEEPSRNEVRNKTKKYIRHKKTNLARLRVSLPLMGQTNILSHTSCDSSCKNVTTPTPKLRRSSPKHGKQPNDPSLLTCKRWCPGNPWLGPPLDI